MRIPSSAGRAARRIFLVTRGKVIGAGALWMSGPRSRAAARASSMGDGSSDKKLRGKVYSPLR